MRRFFSIQIAVLLLASFVTAAVFAAKPVSGDKTPPGSLAPTVVPGIRGLSLRFVATGDDGTSGTATAYETRIAEGSCAGAMWPSVWTVQSTVPQASGKSEGIPFSPLASNLGYCLQVRARDDVNLYSPIAQIESATLSSAAGNWTLTALPGFFANAYIDTVVDPSNDTVLMAVLDKSSAGVTGVKVVRVSPAVAPVNARSSFDYDNLLAPTVRTPLTDDCLLSSTDCVVQIALTDSLFAGKLDRIDSQDLSTSPAIALDNGVVGVLLVGKLGTVTQAVLLERRADGWHSETVTRPAELLNNQALAFTYANGNPVYTWVRVDSADVSTLVLAERSGGSWTNTNLFSRRRAACCSTPKTSPAPPTFQRSLFRDSAGRLKLWVAPDSSGGGSGGVNGVYVVRTLGASNDPQYGIAGCSSPWTYYFTALLDSSALGYIAALDQNGQFLAAAQPLASNIQVLLSREGVPGQLSAAQCGTSLSTAGNMRDTSLSWTNVTSDVPSSWSGGQPSDGPQGLSTSSACSGVQIGLNVPIASGRSIEAQLINHDGLSAYTQRVDHVRGRGTRDALQSMANGDQVLVYWNSDPNTLTNHFVFARGPASCF